MGSLTDNQVATLILIERVTASISVVGTLLLILTFLFIKDFRTLSNTLIFYASFANLFSNVAALIGGAALTNVSGALCQFQSFLLEMFMQSDPMWSLAMAVNVYLVFFKRFDAIRLKRLYWVYAVLCYGLPFIPAMVCLLLKSKGDIYGNAILWCWIDEEWQPLRIYSYYMPVWICILIAVIIYIRVGVEIFRTRSQLRALDNSSGQQEYEQPKSQVEPFTGLRTTEVEVTHDEFLQGELAPPLPIYSQEKKNPTMNRYSITISSPDRIAPGTTKRSNLLTRPNNMDKIKWAYTKVAMLFAISIFITWVPSSINRIYGLRYHKEPSFPLNIGSAIVLPLQGFWNTVIYFTTSISVCKGVWARFRGQEKRSRGFTVLDIPERQLGDKERGSVVEISVNRSRESIEVNSLQPNLELADIQRYLQPI